MLTRSARLTLRTTEVTDVPFVVDTERQEENRPFIGQWEQEQHLEALTNEDIRHLIIEDVDGKPVGYVIVMGLEDRNKSVCIKRIAIQEKGKGYGQETLKLLLQWIFECTNAHRVWLHVKELNHRASHVYESAGFVLEGTLRDSIYTEQSGFESLNVMSVLKPEFEAKLG